MGSLRPDTSHPPSRTVSPISPSSALPTNDDIEAIIQLATSSSPLPQKDTRTQLFVGNLPYRVRWQDLKDLFRKAGTVLRADVSLGPDNRSRGYGTVLLASAEDAGRAIDMFNGYNWQTRVLEVRLDRLPVDLDSLGLPAGTGTPNAALSPFIAPAMDEYSILDRPSSSGGTRSLFVGNLPFHCQWQDLKDLFRQAGTILRADVALGPDGRSRGFGTVSFATESDAERAVGMFNGYEYNGRQLKVHHDRYSQSAASAQPLVPTSPLPYLHSHTSSLPHSPLPNAQVHSPLSLPHLSSFQHLNPQHGPSPLHRQVPGQQSDSASESTSNQQALEGLGRPTAIPMPPPGYQFEFIASSAPSSPFGHPGMYMMGYAPPEHEPPPPPPPQSNRSSSASTTTPASPMKTHHPGPIALPPPLPLPVHPQHMSPLAHPMSPHVTMGPGGMGGMVAMTPAGLPPITPSMPSFNFAYAQQQHTPGPPPLPQAYVVSSMLSPPMFSPGLTMSPGTPVFWAQGRAGNAAVGAPVHNEGAGAGGEASYFPPVSGQVDYFWGAGVGSGLRNEVGADSSPEEERGRDVGRAETHRSGSGESGVTEGFESSSAATSWEEEVAAVGEGLGAMGVEANGVKQRTTSMNEEHPRRPAPGPIQGHGQGRAGSDPVLQTAQASGVEERKGRSEDELRRHGLGLGVTVS